MYLDAGSTILLIQAIFTLFATALAMLSRPRAWMVSLWARITRKNRGNDDRT